MKSWIQLAQQQSKTFELAVPLIIGETYTISMNSNEPFIISVGDVFVGETVDGSLEFIATNSGDVMITSHSDISMEFEIKLELGSRTPWSPAPEDAYGLDLPNGAYHIFGGNSFAKTVEEGVQASVATYAWSNIALNGTELPINGIERYREDFNKIEFTGTDLDFIAYDPVISTDSLIEYRSQSYEQHSTISPISQVQVYWDDVSAFEAGDDTMSTIIINTPWATRNSTDYIYSILGGYQYKPTQGSQVYADPAIQLGDTFTYGDTNQLVASVIWHFDGSVTGDFNAPQNNDSNLDDPRETLIKNEFKKKISLGDSYQGVTIGREDGLQMLASPDGTIENATGRFYTDLRKGMAFQDRPTINDPWRDWLYFDMNENIFKLTLYNTEAEVDAKIQLMVTYMNAGNIMPTPNDTNGYIGWLGGSRIKYTNETIINRNILYRPGLAYNHGFLILENEDTLSGWMDSFINTGYDTSPIARVIPDIEYSLRAKVVTWQAFSLEILEYQTLTGAVTKSTLYEYNETLDYLEITQELETDTRYIRYKINHNNSTISDRLEIADVMVNRGLPKEWYESSQDVKVWAESQINVLAGEIELNSTAIDKVNGDIHNASVEINAIEGVKTFGKKFEVWSEDRQTNYMRVDDTGVNARHLNVESGNISVFQIVGDGLIAGTMANRSYIRPSSARFVGDGDGQWYGSTSIDAVDGDPGIEMYTTWFDQTAQAGYALDHTYKLIRERGSGYVRKTVADQYETMWQWVGGVDQGPTSFSPSTGLSDYFYAGGEIQYIPYGDMDLGTSAARWNRPYFKFQPNVSSDEKLKGNIRDLDPVFLEIFGRHVKPKTYTQNDINHFGYIAQDVEKALEEYVIISGESVDDYAVLSRDGEFMSLLYGEIDVIMHAYQELRYNKLLERLEELEKWR